LAVLRRGIAALGAALTLVSIAIAQPAPLVGLRFTDQRGQVIHAATFAGRPTLVHMVYTGCSAICPLQVRELADVKRALPRDVQSSIRFLSISIDPLHDTPATLAEFAHRMDADLPGWHFVTGRPDDIATIVDRLQGVGARASERPEDHRTSLYLYDATGRLVQRYRGVPVDRQRLVAEITKVAHLTEITNRPFP
jgi:protein SCO1/2